MPRSPIVTRVATDDDVPVLVTLWAELPQVGGRAFRTVKPAAGADAGDSFRICLADPDCRVVLASVGEEPAGMAVLWAMRPDPMSTARVVQVMHVVVARGQRRRGVGHALLAAAADFAEDRQVEHLATGVYPSFRDVSRFYARLGFAPMHVQRMAPVAAVRRRLIGERTGPRVDHAVRRRTRMRRPLPPQRVAAHPVEPGDRP